MLLYRFGIGILLTILLPLTGCVYPDSAAPDADEPGLTAELGMELRTDLYRVPPCEEVGGCPVDLPVTRPIIYRLWGSSANDVWAVGKGSITLNWNGSSWRRFGNPGTGDLWAVWGTASNNVWAVGNDATILHWNGSAWSKAAGLPTTSGFNDVWGTAANDVWTVGDSGAILHFDGTNWSKVSIPYINGFMTVWSAAPNDAWVGGEAGLLLHWDGTKMTEVPTGSADTVWRIRGSSVSNVYLTTDGEAVRNWDGSKWSAPISGATGQEVWVVDDSKVWVTRSTTPPTPTTPPLGITCYWNGLVWTSKTIVTNTGINAVWATGMDGWISSGNGQFFRLSGTSWVKW